TDLGVRYEQSTNGLLSNNIEVVVQSSRNYSVSGLGLSHFEEGTGGMTRKRQKNGKNPPIMPEEHN
ncbi:10527_t:CDS:1, partial [Ambispora gerdemannii]